MSIKLGFGLYYHMLDDEHLAFAKQCGATHLIVHLVDYFNKSGSEPETVAHQQPIGSHNGWGTGGSNLEVWEPDYLQTLKKQIEDHGLVWYAVENFDPVSWYDVLLAGEKRNEQLNGLKQIIQNLGEVGVPVMGYNFSLAGVSSRIEGPFARGGAVSVGMNGHVDENPIPRGMIWNMVYDKELLQRREIHESINHEELWERLEYFLKALVPTAEKVGVTLAAHPDDPPAKWVRQQPRLVYRPELYRRLLGLHPSHSNGLELCLGTLQEMDMSEASLYDFIDEYTSGNRTPYIHLRNVQGRCPNYKEVFIDEGDINVRKVIQILNSNHYNGVIIPDHAPSMASHAPWESGMAFAMGYLKAIIDGHP